MEDMELILKRLGENLDAVDNLNLSNRSLKELPFFITSLKHIKYLYLDNNNLMFVPEIGILLQLEELSIENNQLTFIPETFNGLKRLKLLNLSRNNIKCISSSLFSGLTSLTTLWMNNCELMFLPKEIKSLKCIEKIGMSRITFN